ncbi:MAG TPA: hypothetical protein VFA32_14640, partial [Dehalococcoidia bacterium]|nr:hypothetical protein [Dehalococcoidia bacterium]
MQREMRQLGWWLVELFPWALAIALVVLGIVLGAATEAGQFAAAYFAAGEFAAGVFAAAIGFAAGVFAVA